MSLSSLVNKFCVTQFDGDVGVISRTRRGVSNISIPEGVPVQIS